MQRNIIAEERNYRPTLEEYIGQGDIMPALRVMIQSALIRNTLLEHILFYGKAGVGKTSLAYALALALELPWKEIGAPCIERVGDLVSVLVSLPKGGSVLFIDEVHQMDRRVAESLYPALEDFKVSIPLDKGDDAKVPITIGIEPFTFIGATTDPGLLTKPLLDRFGQRFLLKPHALEESVQVALRLARLRHINMPKKAAQVIAERSRGIPRITNRLVRRTFDLAVARGEKAVTPELADDAMRLIRIDQHGLEDTDREIIYSLCHKHNGGPVGKHRLAASAGIDFPTFERSVGPYLEEVGLAVGKPNGWVLTRKGYQHVEHFTQNNIFTVEDIPAGFRLVDDDVDPAALPELEDIEEDEFNLVPPD